MERFGFRSFEVSGTGFKLNGEPIHLFFESAHSVHYGGHDTPSGHQRDPYRTIREFKESGYNMLRTAHMPIAREFLRAADELGMMINFEWGYCFITTIREPEFEANNLPELERFIYRDHNHPSVVMWTLGNEVTLTKDEAVPRQLDKQTALTRRLDLQKRPVCAFSANGNVGKYGRVKLDTDVIDFHSYTGITVPYTLWNTEFQRLYDEAAVVYGRNGKIDKPVIISECVGGGWGFRAEPDFRPGDVDAYVRMLRQSYSFSTPGAAGYSGVIGIEAALDPKRGRRYLQSLLGRRILGLIRQDGRIAGAAPWFADPGIAGTKLWNQPIYPGIRHDATDGLTPLQYFAPGIYRAEAFVVNHGNSELRSPKFTATLELENGKVFSLGEAGLKPLPAGEQLALPFELRFPSVSAGGGDLVLTVRDGEREVGVNRCRIFLHEQPKPCETAREIALLAPDDALRAVFAELKIPHRLIASATELGDFSAAILPPESRTAINGAILRRYVEQGGRLLILEPAIGPLPGFQEYRSIEAGGSLVDLAVPSHPVFSGLCPGDFDTWVENRSGFVVERAIGPLDHTVLAARGGLLQDSRIAAAMTEAAAGNGRVMVSCLTALRLWKKNAAATRYLANLLGYLAAPEKPYAARTLPQHGTFVYFAAVPERLEPVASDGEPEIKIGAIPFRSMVESRKVITLNAKVATLYLLYQESGKATIRYADGSTENFAVEKVSLPGIPTGYQLGVWNNPNPDRKLTALEAADRIFAVTMERTAEHPKIVLDARKRHDNWGLVSDPAGKPAFAKSERTANPAGEWSCRIVYPAHEERNRPVALLKFDRELRPDSACQVISLLIRVSGRGVVDLVLPEARWLSTLTRRLELEDSGGKWIRLRLSLEEFRFSARKFPFENMRPEIGFYKRADLPAGYLGNAMTLEIADVRFE